MQIKRAVLLRSCFQVLMVIVAFTLLRQPFARPDSFVHRLIYAAILVSFLGAIYVAAYAIWPREADAPPNVKRFFIVAILFVIVSLAIWEPWLSQFPRLEALIDWITVMGNGYGTLVAIFAIFAIAQFVRWLRARTSQK
jgi:hypothetical protein